MTKEQREAHLRMLETLPNRIIEGRAAPLRTTQGTRPKDERDRIHEQILKLIEQGLRDFQISDMLGVSRTAVANHRKGKIKAYQK